MSLNAVLLDNEGNLLPLNSLERTLAIHHDISFQLLCGSGFPGSSTVFSAPTGSVHLTNYRFIYLASDQSCWFKSFSCTYNRLKNLALKPASWFARCQITADVDPSEEELLLKQMSRMTLGVPDDGAALRERIQSLLFSGPVDPEQFAEPLPRYQSPPPAYDQIESSRRAV